MFVLNNTSTLRVSNGAPLMISGTAVVNVGGVLYRFEAGGNSVLVTNSACGTSCSAFGGAGGQISVAFTGHASSSQVNVVSGIRGSGMIGYSGLATADIVLNGPTTRLIISGSGGN